MQFEWSLSWHDLSPPPPTPLPPPHPCFTLGHLVTGSLLSDVDGTCVCSCMHALCVCVCVHAFMCVRVRACMLSCMLVRVCRHVLVCVFRVLLSACTMGWYCKYYTVRSLPVHSNLLILHTSGGGLCFLLHCSVSTWRRPFVSELRKISPMVILICLFLSDILLST